MGAAGAGEVSTSLYIVAMTTSTGGDAEKKAVVQESVTNLASGARQKVGGARADTQAAATKMMHPFSKGEKEGADSHALASKAATKEREVGVRAAGAQEAAGQRQAAKGGNMGHAQDYHQHFSDAGPATYTGNPGIVNKLHLRTTLFLQMVPYSIPYPRRINYIIRC